VDSADSEADDSGGSGGETGESEPETGAETGGLVFSAAELQLGLVVLVGFFAYSAWVAYATFFEVWAFGVAASTGVGLLLLVGLYVVGGEADTAEPAEPAEPAEQQEQTAADGSATPPADDGKSVFGAGEEETPAETEPEPATATDTDAGTDRAHSSLEGDDELLSPGEASEIGTEHAAVDLSRAKEGSNSDEKGADTAEPSEVSDDD